MPDRITPYKPGGSIEDRIDEIVAENATVHFEMLDTGTAYMAITSGGIERRYTVYAKARSLIMRFDEENPAPALANQPGEM